MLIVLTRGWRDACAGQVAEGAEEAYLHLSREGAVMAEVRVQCAEASCMHQEVVSVLLDRRSRVPPVLPRI